MKISAVVIKISFILFVLTINSLSGRGVIKNKSVLDSSLYTMHHDLAFVLHNIYRTTLVLK